MKKRIISSALLVAIVLSLMTSCFFSREFEITYDYGGARSNVTLTFNEGELILNDTPTREGYDFGGWYTDAGFTQTYNFEYPPTSDMTLYAKWIPMYEKPQVTEELMNEITLSTIRANVKLKVEKWNYQQSLLGTTKTDFSTSTGSGIIYAERGGYYYCLTNNHVASKGGKDDSSIKLIDCFEREYAGELVASDPNYDLAVVRFKVNTQNAEKALCALDISEGSTAIGETVICVGSPSGQMNAVTFGRLLTRENITVKGSDASLSNVQFSVFKHDAHMDNGSSGGALLNTSLKIIGINFAAGDSGGEFKYGFAIPSEKVVEFLAKNNL